MGFFSALFGGNSGFKDAQKEWDKYYKEVKPEYQRIANQGISNTAYQQALAAERDMLKDNLNTIRATSAITGATPAAESIARDQAMEAIADSTARMGANITADRNQAMQGYLQAARDAAKGKADAAVQQAQAETQAGSQLIGSVFGMGSSLLGNAGLFKK